MNINLTLAFAMGSSIPATEPTLSDNCTLQVGDVRWPVKATKTRVEYYASGRRPFSLIVENGLIIAAVRVLPLVKATAHDPEAAYLSAVGEVTRHLGCPAVQMGDGPDGHVVWSAGPALVWLARDTNPDGRLTLVFHVSDEQFEEPAYVPTDLAA